MIISPPFLPAEGLTVPAEKWKTDPMMDVVDKFELTYSGVFPIASDRRWHCGMHLVPDCGLGQKEPVRAIADGEVVAYRVVKNAISDGQKNADGTAQLNSNTGFVLLKHTTDTGEGRTITFYSLYMHLLDLVSTQALVPQPQPSEAPQNSSPNALPKWLLAETEGVQPGGGKKVYRKDQLGYVGKYHNETHLHFEIFMTEADYTAWFEQQGHQVGLGNTHPETPASKDYWGHTYYVIPEKSAFVSVPPEMASLNTGGHTPKPFFPALDEGVLGDGHTLYVQTYFSRGERFMRAWIDQGDGTLVSLTPDEPIKDKFDEYEYRLYERAMKLYETCPSDGYEMLRFGRILSTDTPTLPAEAQATWLAVPFDQGKVGYIDVSQPTVKKLSDADFPFFMDWQKIEDGNTPFDGAGLCGYDELCRITGVTDLQSPDAATLEEFSHEESLKSYVQGQVAVRAKLKGFICHAKSEWDASNNEDRYGGLKAPEGFFGKRKDVDPDGYTHFIEFVEQSQFMGQVQVQSGEENKFWFFHPLAFIRHFRKCGWLSANELARCLPRASISANVTWDVASERGQSHHVYVSHFFHRYLNSRAERLLHFLAQTYIETGCLRTMNEDSRGHGHIYGPFYGRGYLQLTWPKNYENYKNYKRLPDHGGGAYSDSRITSTSTHVWADGASAKKWAPLFDPAIVATDLMHAAESSAMYWVSKTFRGTKNINRAADVGTSPLIVAFISWLVNGGGNGYKERQQFAVLLADALLDNVPKISREVFSYPPLTPPGDPTLCRTFPPTSVPFSQQVTIDHVPQIP